MDLRLDVDEYLTSAAIDGLIAALEDCRLSDI